MLPPLSLPQMSGKTSETGENNNKTQTFKDDRIFDAPKVAKELRVPVGHNVNRFSSISENIELVGMPEIISRVNFDTVRSVPICVQRHRKLCIKMGVVPESQSFLFVLKTAEVPQNLLKT